MDGDPDLLASDGAFVDLSDWRKTDVSGVDALSWLDRHVSAPVADLAPGRARQALLLSAEGGLRAEFTVAVAGSSVLLLQDPGQDPRYTAGFFDESVAEGIQRRDRTLDLDHDAGGIVQFEPGQIQLRGKPVDRRPKADALDNSLDAQSPTFAAQPRHEFIVAPSFCSRLRNS